MAESRDVPLLPAAPSRGRSTVRLSPRRAPGRGERRRTAEGEAILREGFRDAEGSYMLANTVLRGVFVSDVPLDINEGAAGGELLELTLSAELALDDFELVEDGKPYREWCVPAEILNSSASVRRLTQVEEDALGSDVACPSWCTREGCDGQHLGEPTGAFIRATGEHPPNAMGESFAITVAPSGGTKPGVFVAVGPETDVEWAIDLSPEEARRLAIALIDAAEIVDPPRATEQRAQRTR